MAITNLIDLTLVDTLYKQSEKKVLLQIFALFLFYVM